MRIPLRPNIKRRIAVKNFIREKKIYCGENYLEVDIIPKSEDKRLRRGKRSKKKQLSAPKQKRLNDKNAKRYFIQLLNSNFGYGDIHISATYSDDELPATLEDAEREAKNYIRRIDYRRKKEGLSPLKYILVTEGRTEKDGETPVRIHHHIIINQGLDRDVVESLWCRRRKKGEKEGKRIGFVNADRLQPNEYGIEAIARYISKDPQGKKRWTGSHNLVKPWSRDNDSKYKRRELEKAIRNDDRYYWESKYPGYWLTEYRPVYNDFTGWSVYLKLRRSD